ncbi:cytochrome-c peroxidase [Cohaesibacter gelatinilyticus]|uniref:Methylamine utilization protein MauG n=1 Tax=Cohaesibacter gelatinilyticus TaxID=372072 RepID=A0A285PE61_9HYPH|nr:cytochrome c peroxidase [Cohaesibacter gelatinilyticus]SNZ20012.1 cytochrome c peroxidase [Cohaesibacter gelatinilyticus]
MYGPNIELMMILFSALGLGMLALALVSKELAQRVRLGGQGRLFLACGLGLGVFALSIKAGVILYLEATNPNLASARLAQTVPLPPQSPKSTKVVTLPAQLAKSGNWSTWQALPRIAKAPANNPQSLAKAKLGKKLFFDKNLSIDRTVSCASCHDLEAGGDDNAPVSTGVGGQKGGVSAPTVLNAAFLTRLFWDGRAASLEDQAKQPFINPVEMAMPHWQAVEERVKANDDYAPMFERAFGQEARIDIDAIAKAIASYERLLITPNAPYDRFIAGDDTALNAQQLRGMALFQEVGCRTCHIDPVFSAAGQVKNIGTYRSFPVFADNSYVTKYDLLVDGEPSVWRVPSLRNIAQTGPYFHNGAVKDLKEAIRIMAVSQLGKVISDDPSDDLAISSVSVGEAQNQRRLTILRDQALNSQDIEDLEAFLKSLSGDVSELNF